MKKLISILFALIVAFSISAQDRPQIVPGNIIVQVPSKSVQSVIAANQTFEGQPTGLKFKKMLSAPMAAYLLEFDPNIHHERFLQQLWDHPSVTLVQLNHVIRNRATTPNDPQFGQQWWHRNTGGNGGVNDADIDSDLAWDITTGGLTALGDTIVACVVDDGGDLDHPDLMANNWVNHHEIPDNNMDDDGNGYVDDYLGWNPNNDNDNVDGGSHGVSVAGMIGAHGNNGVGVSGVNWNVKIMNCRYGNIGGGSNPNEANVIEAYTYPLVMRQQYEATNGALGAYVVVTNSSWGIDGADPLDAPIWCAFYDTLGAYGVLSTGATANNNVNIDVVGDLPTACSSEYLISVTATDNSDVRTFSGYGITTVDLGAPGEDVRTTSAGNYTTTSGTSFATPATAGAVALMYSAPCASLAAISHSDPSLAAEMVRDAIFSGVDPVNNLASECVTGGRLNLKNSLDLIVNSCATGGCLQPYSLSANNITDAQVSIQFGFLAEIDTFQLAYGTVGGSATVIQNITASPYQLNGLSACTEYWVVMNSICDNVTSQDSDTLFFNTDGCCVPPGVSTITLLTDTSARATWPTVLAATGYYVQFRPQGSSWAELPLDTNSVMFIGLDPCTTYEVRVATICVGGPTSFGPIQTFTTTGCGACTDNTYCPSNGVVDYEWIDQVTIGDINYTSSASASGYDDRTDLSTDLERDSTHSVTLSPGFANSSFTEHFRVWIDLNQDGTFQSSELLFDDVQGSQNTVNGSISIPATAQLGSTRMRVSMAYGTSFSGDYPQSACATGQDGEVEDFCVNIIEKDTVGEGLTEHAANFGVDVFPIPATDVLTVRLKSHVKDVTDLRVYDALGRQVMTITYSGGNAETVAVEQLAVGSYTLTLLNTNGETVGRARFLKQ